MEFDYYKFANNLQCRYGASVKVDLDLTTNIFNSIDLNLEFPHYDCLKQFVIEITKLQQWADEEKIREENPVVQRAYEEYKLLLKLSK